MVFCFPSRVVVVVVVVVAAAVVVLDVVVVVVVVIIVIVIVIVVVVVVLVVVIVVVLVVVVIICCCSGSSCYHNTSSSGSRCCSIASCSNTSSSISNTVIHFTYVLHSWLALLMVVQPVWCLTVDPHTRRLSQCTMDMFYSKVSCQYLSYINKWHNVGQLVIADPTVGSFNDKCLSRYFGQHYSGQSCVFRELCCDTVFCVAFLVTSNCEVASRR